MRGRVVSERNERDEKGCGGSGGGQGRTETKYIGVLFNITMS